MNILGAIRWLAPELCFNPPERSSFASDIWAYGCLILEIATQDLPWIKEYERNRELMKALAEKRNAANFQQICREQRAPKKFIEILCACCTWPKHNRPCFVDIIQDFYSLSNDDFQFFEKTSYTNRKNHYEQSRYKSASALTIDRKGKNSARDESLYSADENDDN